LKLPVTDQPVDSLTELATGNWQLATVPLKTED
jgi:hypothetical protein